MIGGTKESMCNTNKKRRKEALELFKLVQMYMGDRMVRGRSLEDVCLEIVGVAWGQKDQRDELFIQLCKQTTLNRNA